MARKMVAYIELLFWFSSLYILPFWLMMLFVPYSERTAAMLRSEWVYLAPLAAAYSLAVLPHLGDILLLLGSDMPTPAIVLELFENEEVVIVGWLHYLAFDLFVGRWTWKRLTQAEKPLLVSFPVLLLSMMVAPLGALVGMVVTKDAKAPAANDA